MHKFCPLGREVVELKKEQRIKEEEKKKAVPPKLLFPLLPVAEARLHQHNHAATPTIKCYPKSEEEVEEK